jgi:hypothetical protein
MAQEADETIRTNSLMKGVSMREIVYATEGARGEG